jgi:6-phosphofructokinase 1
MPAQSKKSIGVLTSGGDAPGMNAAVRAVVRTALARGVEVYAIREGYQGMVDGGNQISPLNWGSVGSILQLGGTVIGTARCAAFRTRDGRRQAARNLLRRRIDGLVVIGGDGSLTGADTFRREWPELLAELVERGEISQKVAERHAHLAIVGLVGSIDNDMFGTDMTIGTDTALHRITEALDALSSTAASHQRTFIVEVMGRRCGYLALMGAISGGADWVMIPENPPNVDNWEDKMCEVLKEGRDVGHRRDSIVIVAEGAQDRQGRPISSQYVQMVLEDHLGEDARVTILGHVQRGGAPSACDRYLSTMMGYAAVDTLLAARSDEEPQLVGIRGNRIVHSPLMEAVRQTQAVNEAISTNDYKTALALRGSGFQDAFRTLRTLVRAVPHPPKAGQKSLRLAVMHSGGPAPGMNTAVRAAVRLGLDHGHTMLGVEHGFKGLVAGDIKKLDWMSVNGWATRGGAELGTNRVVPEGSDFYTIARNIEEHRIDGLLIIGGWTGYQSAHALFSRRASFPAFNIPIVCLPSSIDNDLPGSELSIGADTALNNIVRAVDKIKQSAVASQRCFVVEVMGRYCGYLALMSGMATGAERVYLNEEGIRLADLQADLARLVAGFEDGRRLALLVRNEYANPLYTTEFLCSLFEEESKELFDVRKAILGHLQQGGDPSPFDRIQATRLAARCIEYLIEQAGRTPPAGAFVGLQAGEVKFFTLEDLPRLLDTEHRRPKEQWWMDLRPIVRLLAQPGPEV